KNANKFCEFHEEVGHTTDECWHLKRQIKEMLKAGKLSHLIKELKQSNWKDQAKTKKKGSLRKGQAAGNPDGTAMAEGEEDGTEGPMIIEAEMGGHFVYHMYVDRGSYSEILSPSPYNGIIGRPGVMRIQEVPSTAHEMLKFPVTKEGRKKLCGLLRRNLDIFAWMPADMTGVPRHIAEHMLNIRERCIPIRQKKKGQAPGRNKAIYKEVEKLVKAGSMKEVHYHS
ncbi:hypothetical protein Tco_1431516, partial [Tanacetum coccineum]